MSTLVLALALCSALGNVPKRVCPEVEQRLTLPGTWMGTTTVGGYKWHCEASRGALTLSATGKHFLAFEPFRFVDEGRGQFRIEANSDTVWAGIYRWDGSRVVICFSSQGSQERPTSFRASSRQLAFTLHRVKEP